MIILCLSRSWMILRFFMMLAPNVNWLFSFVLYSKQQRVPSSDIIVRYQLGCHWQNDWPCLIDNNGRTQSGSAQIWKQLGWQTCLQPEWALQLVLNSATNLLMSQGGKSVAVVPESNRIGGGLLMLTFPSFSSLSLFTLKLCDFSQQLNSTASSEVSQSSSGAPSSMQPPLVARHRLKTKSFCIYGSQEYRTVYEGTGPIPNSPSCSCFHRVAWYYEHWKQVSNCTLLSRSSLKTSATRFPRYSVPSTQTMMLMHSLSPGLHTLLQMNSPLSCLSTCAYAAQQVPPQTVVGVVGYCLALCLTVDAAGPAVKGSQGTACINQELLFKRRGNSNVQVSVVKGDASVAEELEVDGLGKGEGKGKNHDQQRQQFHSIPSLLQSKDGHD